MSVCCVRGVAVGAVFVRWVLFPFLKSVKWTFRLTKSEGSTERCTRIFNGPTAVRRHGSAENIIQSLGGQREGVNQFNTRTGATGLARTRVPDDYTVPSLLGLTRSLLTHPRRSSWCVDGSHTGVNRLERVVCPQISFVFVAWQHRHAVVVLDLSSCWIQSFPLKNKKRQRYEN